MKYDKTTIIGLSVCVGLFLLWPTILRRFNLAPISPGPANVERQRPPAPGDPDRPVSPSKAAATDASTTEAAPSATSQPAVPGDPSTAVSPAALHAPWAKPVDITTRLTSSDLFTPEVDPDGGGIVTVSLSQYARRKVRDESQREAVVLGRWDHPFLALDLRHTGYAFGPAAEMASEPGYYEMRRQTAEGITLTESWSTPADSPYRIRYSVRIRNDSGQAAVFRHLAVEAGAIPPNISGRTVKTRGMGAGGVTLAFTDAKRPKLFSAKKIKKQTMDSSRVLAARPTKWLAVHSQYFVLALIAGDMTDGTTFAGTQMDLRPPAPASAPGPANLLTDGWFNTRGILADTTVPAGQEVTFDFTGVVGPKKRELLVDVGGRLDTIIGMDTFLFWHPQWMGFLTRCLVRLLVWLNDLFGVSWGYGLAIIVITLAVKTLFWPLTHHSTKSMRKMQVLQPQLKELRERYKDEPQKLYRKQSEFLKEHKVSQLGGCLPMLLQLPVFFALFITFRSAIELRHASFLWAMDLSTPDDIFGLPIRPLAILMGLTMLLQQKLTPTSGDPQQQRMMMFMSAFFIFLFYSMPSGLTLYWTVNQLLSIVQTLLTRHLEKRDTA